MVRNAIAFYTAVINAAKCCVFDMTIEWAILSNPVVSGLYRCEYDLVLQTSLL